MSEYALDPHVRALMAAKRAERLARQQQQGGGAAAAAMPPLPSAPPAATFAAPMPPMPASNRMAPQQAYQQSHAPVYRQQPTPQQPAPARPTMPPPPAAASNFGPPAAARPTAPYSTPATTHPPQPYQPVPRTNAWQQNPPQAQQQQPQQHWRPPPATHASTATLATGLMPAASGFMSARSGASFLRSNTNAPPAAAASSSAPSSAAPARSIPSLPHPPAAKPAPTYQHAMPPMPIAPAAPVASHPMPQQQKLASPPVQQTAASASTANGVSTTAAATAPTNIWSSVRRPVPPPAPATATTLVAPVVQAPAAAAASSSTAPTAQQQQQQQQQQAVFLAKFHQPLPAGVSPLKGGGGAGGPRPFETPQPTPLCRGHTLPMTSAICRKEPNVGQKFWNCCYQYTSPANKCSSFVWDRDLATSGLRMQQRGPNGETISEVQFALDICSTESFTVTLSPPDKAASDLLRAEGGVVDEKAIGANVYAKTNPNVFIFSLQQYDALLQTIEKARVQNHYIWTVVPIPTSARELLLKDLQMTRLKAYAAPHAEPETDVAHLVASSFAPSPGITIDGTSPTISTHAPAAAAAATNSNVEHDSDFEDEEPKAKRKKGGNLLTTKTMAMQQAERAPASAAAKAARARVEASRHLTLEEQTKLNVEKLPPVLRVVLLPFQMEGVEYLVSRGGRGLLADEMGLGKSLQALTVASYYHEDWPLLIVCPSSLRLNWQEEITRWLSFMNKDRIFVVLTAKDGHACLKQDPDHKVVQGHRYGIVIISYDLCTKLIEEIKAYKFNFIIADESHNLKSDKAQRTKAILPLLKKATRALLLTGTPALNRPAELYTQISAVKPNLFPKFQEFGLRYCAGHKVNFGGHERWDYTGSSHLFELNVLLKKYLLIRREKSQVLHQLPPKRRQTVILDVPASKLRQLKQLKAEYDQLQEDDLQRGQKNDPHLTKMFQLTGEAKVDAVCEYIDELIESGIKFLIFGHHLAVLDRLEQHVRNHKQLPAYIRIDGSTPPIKRQALVQQFQKEEGCQIALLSITAAGTGLTLTAASHVVMAELNWTPAILAQAEDRVHRIGQSQSSVNIHYLLARGTLDDLMWPLISKKLAVIGTAVAGEEMHMEIDQTKQLSAVDREQKKLTGFYSQSQATARTESLLDDNDDDAFLELAESAAPFASPDRAAIAAEYEAKHGTSIEDDEEVGLFYKSAPSSASSKRSTATTESPLKRRKTGNLLTPASSSAAATSRPPAATSSTSADNEFPVLSESDADEFDLTCTPVPAPRPAPNVGVSASSVKSNRSPNVRPSFASPQIERHSATSSPRPVASPARSPPSATSSASNSPAITSSTRRRRKRIRDEDDEEEAKAPVADEAPAEPMDAMGGDDDDFELVDAEIESKSTRTTAHASPKVKPAFVAATNRLSPKPAGTKQPSFSPPVLVQPPSACSLFPSLDDDDGDFLD